MYEPFLSHTLLETLKTGFLASCPPSDVLMVSMVTYVSIYIPGVSIYIPGHSYQDLDTMFESDPSVIVCWK